MPNTIYDTYLQAEVQSADPVTLVHMLYRGAIEAVAAARRHLAAAERHRAGAAIARSGNSLGPGATGSVVPPVTHEIRERSRQITKAWEILRELNGALDHKQAPELSARLAALYSYMQTRLIEANSKQADAPLSDVETLLNTLATAWQAVRPASSKIAEAGQTLERVSCAC